MKRGTVMDKQYYVLTTANNDFFINFVKDDNLQLTKFLSQAHLYNDFEDAKILANLYGLNVHDINLSQRFDCGVWKK